MSAPECIICLEEITRPILLPCNHSEVCIRCFMTMSQCYGVRMCPCCQATLTEDPIIADTLHPTDYHVELFKDYQHDTKFNVFYKDPAVLQDLEALMTFHCRVCHKEFSNFKQFSNHVGVHHLRVCKICSRAHRALPSQVEIFNGSQFKKHMKQHPTCPCCNFTAFDQTVLAEHMRENHFRCDVCAAEGKVLWFPSVDLIRVHFHECHFACEDPMCVDQGFIVFGTRMELQLHRIEVHGDPAPAQLEFEPTNPSNNEKNEHRERIKKARRDLSAMIASNFPGDRDKSKQMLSLVDGYQARKIKPKQFLKKIEEICGDKSDYVFCNVVAAIGDSRLRGLLVRERSGIRPCRVPTRTSSASKLTDEDFPELSPNPAPSPPPVQMQPPPERPGRKKGRQKKIVLASY